MTASIARCWSGVSSYGKLASSCLDEIAVHVQRDPFDPLALCVQGEQLARKLPRAFARPCFQVLPRLAAELRQRRRRSPRAHVAGDLADLLVRDVEAILAPEREEEVVAGDVGDGLRLEAEELADTVVLVDDEVAGTQVGEALERAPEPRVGTRRSLAKHLRVREQHDSQLPRDEAAAHRGDGEEQTRIARELPPRLELLGVDLAEHGLRPRRLAGVGERDNDAISRLQEPAEVVLGLGKAPRGDRRPLRLERERLPAREGFDRARAVEPNLVAQLLPPDRDAPRRPPRRGRTVRWAARGRPGR